MDRGQNLEGSGAPPGAVAAPDLSDQDAIADRSFGPIVRRFRRGIVEELEKLVPMVVQSAGHAFVRGVEKPFWLGTVIPAKPA